MNECRTCINWIPDEKPRNDGRLLGECKESLRCVCCDSSLIFGGNGGGQFKSTGNFGCILWKKK